MIQSILVDYGGSKTEVLAFDRRRRMVRKLKIRSEPIPQLDSVILRILRRWHIKDLPLLTIGAKSVWSQAEKKWLYQRTRGLAKKVTVMSDIELAHKRIFGRKPTLIGNLSSKR